MAGNQPPPSPWPADSVERRPLASLVPYARNSRVHPPAQVAQLAASLKEWGWTMPVLVDEGNGIIAGHGRVLAAEKLGIADVPVMVARGWSETKKRAYVIADNKLSLNSAWDEEMLVMELGDLREDGFDLGLVGFESAELDKLLDAAAPGPAAPEDFPSYDETIETEHVCPSCGYRFSGAAKPKRTGGGGDESAGRGPPDDD